MSQPPAIRIAPSILNADFCRLAEEIARVEAAGADLLHMDVMDGHFVPNISYGVPVVSSIAGCTKLPLDTHLMVSDPGKIAPAFVDAGSGGITFHIEAAARPKELLRRLRGLGVKVGVALNPGTPAEAVLEIVEEVDLVLVMTVWPGFGGQRFIDECTEKVATLASQLREDQSLEVDGGVNFETIERVVEAGADTLVAGSVLFDSDDPGATLGELRRRALAARRRAARKGAERV